jgi:ubiquitin-protein ligase E3 C
MALSTTDYSTAPHWPPLLLLVDLYAQALLTMGDDEFFASAPVSAFAAATSHTLGSSSTNTNVAALQSASGSSSAGSTSLAATMSTEPARAARNPLSLDELTAFSRQLLNIVFQLYWREDPSGQDVSAGSGVPGVENLSWATARERMTRLLVAIHARE